MAKQESYQGLARKWRPQRFEDLVGQEAVAQSFQSALRQSRVAHGHLLAGPRGVGKTTSARILAKALNCEHGPTATPCGECRHCIDIAIGNDMDVIEIDAASNTGVDNIRELRERVIQAPFAARFKVYIIDEIHMLSTGAFNALLKTLEEPPPQVVFIFATTEIEKVPETIRSRCVVHAFRRLTAEDIARRLAQVAAGENVTADEAIAREIYGLIGRSVEGGMRDALVLFDQLIALTEGKPDVESTIRLLGLADQASLVQTVGWLAGGQAAELLKLIEELIDRGRSLERFVKSLIAYLRDLMLLQAEAGEGLVALSGDALAAAKTQARALAPATLYNILNQMFELEGKLKQSTQARFLIEFTFLRIASIRPVVPLDEILRRVRAIPEGMLGGAPPAAASGSAAVSPAPSTPPRPARFAASEPEPARAAALHDSAPESAAPAAPPGSGAALAGTTGEELLDLLVPQLPDVFSFLGRYLRQAARLVLEAGCLRVVWDGGPALGRRMVEKPENLRVLEETLSRIQGRPMRLVSQDAPSGGDPQVAAPGTPAATPAVSPARRNMTDTEAVFADSAPGWTPTPPSREETAAEEPAADSEGEDDAPPETFRAAAAPRMAEPAGAKKPGETPKDPRSALQKAQALGASGEEARRRVRLLKDMLGGRLIDDSGQPLMTMTSPSTD